MIEIALKNINGKDVPAVTSLQVAESFEKEHKNVLRDIEAILPQVPEKFVKLNFELYEYPIETGIGTRMAKSYLLSKDAFTLLTMGYTGEKAMAFKVAYIARFNEMEKALQANAPTSLPEALRAYANMLEENELIRRQRDEAIRTKAWINDKKTATAMATASAAVRKTGAYATNNALTMPNFSNPAEAARAWADEYEAKQRSALILLKRMRKPPYLDRFGGSCYRKVVTPRADSIGLVLQWGDCVGASSSVEPTNTKRIDDMNDSVKSLVEVSTRTINGKEVLAVTSLQVAEHFGKEHKHVLRDIRIILEADEDGFSESNFGLSSYLTEQNKEMPMYVMSKDGFVLLVMGYTGPEAMRMKKAYIARFNEMEEQLRAASPLLPNFRDPIAAAEAWIVAERARLAEQARADYYQRTKAQIGIRREALTGLPISGILNFPNRTGVTVALAWPHQAVKSGLFCSCHRYTSSGCGHILARRRPGVREAPAAVRAGERRLAFFCAQNPKSY